jgi:hypothetical protein
MKARHKYVGYSWKIINPFGSHRDDLAKTGAYGQIIFGLAMRLTTITSDTAFDILVYVIFTHLDSSGSEITPLF